MTIIARWAQSLNVYVKSKDWSQMRWKNMDKTKIRYPFRFLFHPFDAANDIQFEGKRSLFIANVFMLLFFALQCMSYTSTGYLFNFNEPQDFNIAMMFFQSVLLIILWCISNWLVCSITGGEGTFGDIWVISWYATLPRILLTPISILLSNVLLLNEAAFLNVCDAIGMIWFCLLLFFGMIVIHQYTVSKAIVTVLLTLFCMAMIVFICVLLFSFSQQLVLFVSTVFKELMRRF